jgi:hypothetical protein
MNALEEGFDTGFELWREFVCSIPALKNASKLRDMLLELKDILRILDRRLDSCERPSRVTRHLVTATLTSAVFASSRMPPIAPFRPGIGTPSKVFSRTVRASLRASHACFNASITSS